MKYCILVILEVSFSEYSIGLAFSFSSLKLSFHYLLQSDVCLWGSSLAAFMIFFFPSKMRILAIPIFPSVFTLLLSPTFWQLTFTYQDCWLTHVFFYLVFTITIMSSIKTNKQWLYYYTYIEIITILPSQALC